MSLFLMGNSLLWMVSSQRKVGLCFQARRKVKVKTISELLSIFTEVVDSKLFNTNWGESLSYQPLSYTHFFSQKKKSRFFSIRVDIFLLILFQKHMVEQLSCFFPTSLPWKCSEHQHEAMSESWGVKPWALSTRDHTPSASLGASRDHLLHRLGYPRAGALRAPGKGAVGGGALPVVPMEMKPWKQEPPHPRVVPHHKDISRMGAASQEIRCNCGAVSLGILADGIGKGLCRGSRADVSDLLPWPARGQYKPQTRQKNLLVNMNSFWWLKKKLNPVFISCLKNYPKVPQN